MVTVVEPNRPRFQVSRFWKRPRTDCSRRVGVHHFDLRWASCRANTSKPKLRGLLEGDINVAARKSAKSWQVLFVRCDGRRLEILGLPRSSLIL
jgi:hypothetical protein